MKQKVLIVTRRFKDDSFGLGVEENGFQYEKHLLKPSFIDFWTNQFINHKHLKELLPKLDLPLTNTDLKAKILREPNILQTIFHELDEILDDRYKIKTIDYLKSIREFMLNGQSSCIFVYHHWLDKQQFRVEARKDFLAALRKNVKTIMNSRKIDYERKFNWLIHDSDIVEQQNSVFYLNGKIYHPDLLTKKEEIKETKDIYIHNSLQKDNIWCFQHEKSEWGFYNKIILDFHKNKDLQSIDTLHKYLERDISGCLRRIESKLWTDDVYLDLDKINYLFEGENRINFTSGTVGELKKILMS